MRGRRRAPTSHASFHPSFTLTAVRAARRYGSCGPTEPPAMDPIAVDARALSARIAQLEAVLGDWLGAVGPHEP